MHKPTCRMLPCGRWEAETRAWDSLRSVCQEKTSQPQQDQLRAGKSAERDPGTSFGTRKDAHARQQASILFSDPLNPTEPLRGLTALSWAARAAPGAACLLPAGISSPWTWISCKAAAANIFVAQADPNGTHPSARTNSERPDCPELI